MAVDVVVRGAAHQLHLIDNQLHVRRLLLRVEEERHRLLQLRLHAERLPRHQSRRTDLQHGALAAFLLAFQAVEVAKGKDAYAVHAESILLGLHLRLSRDAKPFKQRKPLLSLSWLSRCLAHDVAHQDFVVFNTFCHDFSEVLKSCHLHAAGHLVKALG